MTLGMDVRICRISVPVPHPTSRASCPGRELRLVDEPLASAVAAEQPRQRIVEGQEQITAGRGKEVSVRPGLFAHVMQIDKPPVRIPDRLVPSSGLRRSRRGYFFGFFGRFFSAARFLAA